MDSSATPNSKSVITVRALESTMEGEPLLWRTAIYLAVLIIAAGLFVIAGWKFQSPVLKGATSRPLLDPTNALCFTCFGLSILLQLSRWRILKGMGVIFGVFITVFAVSGLVESLFAIDRGIDQLSLAMGLPDWNLLHLGHFAPNTALGLAVAGISLCTLRWRKGTPFSEFIALLLVLVPYVSLLGYVYGASPLYDHVMGGPAAFLFGLLGVTLLCASSRHILLDVILSPSAGAIASRKMISVIALLLPALGFLQLWAEEDKYVSLRFGIALSVLAAVTLFIILALRTAAVLNETDRRRREIEAALAKSRQIAAAGRMAASIAHEIKIPLKQWGILFTCSRPRPCQRR